MYYFATVDGEEQIIRIHARNGQTTTLEASESNLCFDRRVLTDADLFPTERIGTIPNEDVILHRRVYLLSFACYVRHGPWLADVYCCCAGLKATKCRSRQRKKLFALEEVPVLRVRSSE